VSLGIMQDKNYIFINMFPSHEANHLQIWTPYKGDHLQLVLDFHLLALGQSGKRGLVWMKTTCEEI